MKRHVSVAAFILLAGGCGSDTTEVMADVTGSWTYNANNLSGGGALCSISNVSMTLTQTGTTFSGTVTSGTVACGTPGGTSGGPLGNALVLNGQVNGSQIQFDIGDANIHNTGTMKNGKLTGDVVLKSGVTFKGTFEATKK